MEGGVFEDERIIGIGNKRGRDEKEAGEKIGLGRLGKRPSGIVDDQDQEYSYSGDEMINGVKYEEEKTSSSTPTSGGFFNQLITNLVNNSPKSSADHHVSANKFGHGSGEIVAGGDDEVVIMNKDDDGHVVEENGGGADHENNNIENGGDSIIDDIVAKLPTTLSEDTLTAPEPDEASILLHSIIHD